MSIYRELAYDRVISHIHGIQFCILSDHEIRERSVVEVTENQAFAGNEPVMNGLFDPRMGVIDSLQRCATCRQTNTFCQGHFGHIELARPVFYIQFFEIVRKLMRCVCFRCSKILINLGSREARAILARKVSRQRRWEAMSKLCMKARRCGHDTADGCGARMPDKIIKTDDMSIRLKLIWKETAAGADDGRETIFNAEDVLRVFRRISAVDCEALGFSEQFNRPEWMICTCFPVPPPSVRPSVRQEGGQRQEDDLTHKLADIVKFNNLIRDRIQKDGGSIEAIETLPNYVPMLQYHVATLIDNSIPSMYPSKDRAGRMLRTLTERLRHKEGRIRGNLMGKRVDFSARTVITPDPNLSIDELGVPLKIAMNLTFPEVVGPWNREQLRELVIAGPDVYPGAKQVRHGHRTVRLRGHPDRESIELLDGDIVERHLRNGDYVLFNRQPSLHKMSMMGHRIRVMPHNTFRLNVCVCSSYNADFDGDEMNMHVPQSLQTLYEVKELAAVPLHILSPRYSKPIINIVQDVLLGVYMITQPNVMVTKRQLFNMVCSNQNIDIEAIERASNIVTGRCVLSTVFPPTALIQMNVSGVAEFNPDIHAIRIHRGFIESGVLSKEVFASGSRGLVHSIYNTLGPDAVVIMLNAIQRLICDWLVLNGFSVGISDLIVPKAIVQEQRKIIQQAKQEVDNILHSVHAGTFNNVSTKSNADYMEDLIAAKLSQGYDGAGKLSVQTANANNRMLKMIESGSKGKNHNFYQMTACLGPQAIENKRVPDGFDHRTLPHFSKFDDAAESRGFVEHSFIEGLSPHEFFFHSMAGRIGLINTAVRTSETGYLQRRLIKAMEDCKVHQDGTVRNANNYIVQFLYGEDGFDPIKLEHHKMPYLDMDITQMCNDFLWTDDEDKDGVFADHFKQLIRDRTAIINIICGGTQRYENLIHAVNIERIIMMVADAQTKEAHIQEPIDPREVIESMRMLVEELSTEHAKRCNYTTWMATLIRCFLSPKRLRDHYKLSATGFKQVIRIIKRDFWASFVNPGEMVGIVAAQSLGEISTQLTLNTFHTSGIAAFTKVTSGIPRMKELMSISKNIKTPMMKVVLQREWATSMDGVMHVLNDIKTTVFRDVVSRSSIFHDPEGKNWKGDMPLMKFHREFCTSATTELPEKKLSPWVLRFEFNKYKMFDLSVTMLDIETTLINFYDSTISCIVSDDNAGELVCRIQLTIEESSSDLLTDIKALEQSILDGLVIKGIRGIEKAMPNKPSALKKLEHMTHAFVADDEWTITTAGSNLLSVMAHDCVDSTRTITNDVYEVFKTLGIEAAREVLIDEIAELLDGQELNYRHLSLLADVMTNRGSFMSIDRHGINNRGELGPLAKCSFEQTIDMLVKAGIFAERDAINGVSANTMLGQIAPCGTGDCTVHIDLERIVASGRPVSMPTVERMMRDTEDELPHTQLTQLAATEATDKDESEGAFEAEDIQIV